MGSFTPAIANKLLDHIMNTTKWEDAFFSSFFGLLLAEPSGGTYQEVTGSGYARAETNFYLATGRPDNSTKNNADVSFPPATGYWGKVTHVGMFDAATGGRLGWYGVLPQPITVGMNDKLIIRKDMLTIRFD